MKIVFLVASALACTFSLEAQITTTLNRLSNRLTEIRIRNNSATTLTAFAITVNVSGGSHPSVMGYYDSEIDQATSPLLPNEELGVPTPKIVCAAQDVAPVIALSLDQRKSGCEPLKPTVIAAIFADGTVTGEASLITRMMSRRSNMLLAVETTIETLSEAGRHNVPRAQLIKEFREKADSLNRWYLPPEQQVGLGLYQSIIGKLMNLPEGEIGSPFPPTDFVETETTTLRGKRIALSESQPSLPNGP